MDKQTEWTAVDGKVSVPDEVLKRMRLKVIYVVPGGTHPITARCRSWRMLGIFDNGPIVLNYVLIDTSDIATRRYTLHNQIVLHNTPVELLPIDVKLTWREKLLGF